jgi:alpha-1,2-mannosyltransferase
MPFCFYLLYYLVVCSNGGGGGERVLWVLVAGMLRDPALSERTQILIYTGDSETVSAADTLRNVKDKFMIDLCGAGDAGRIRFVHIKTRHLLEGAQYKRFTMLMQSLGSVVVGLECLLRRPPDVLFDTLGAAFTYPAARLLAGCRVFAYVHYPIISQDMLQRVREQRPQYNNDARISSSVTISFVKLAYYQIFAVFYSLAGHCAQLAFVNGSWTESHVSGLWGTSPLKGAGEFTPRLVKVFPPCNSEEFSQLPLSETREPLILSVGQFRPEKDHMLQIK